MSPEGLFYAFTSLPNLGAQAELTLDGPRLAGISIPRFSLVLAQPDGDDADGDDADGASNADKLSQLDTVPFQALVRYVLGLNKLTLTSSDVSQIAAALVHSDARLEEQAADLQQLFQRLYSAFDDDGSGVDCLQFLAGIVVLCAGDRDAKINAMFNLYDADGTGSLSLTQLIDYLTALFTVVAETTPRVFNANDTTPAELADDTAVQCFAENGFTDAEEDRITFEVFRDWYLQHPQDQGQGRAGVAAAVDATTEPPAQTYRDVEALTLLTVPSINELIVISHDVIGLEGFTAFLLSYAADNDEDTTQRLRACAKAIFDLYAHPQTHLAAVNELACCLSILCAGSGRDKGVAAFHFFDLNNDGYISPSEMTLYLECVFSVLLKLGPNEGEAMTATQLASATAQQCFEEADTNGDGRVSFDEFQNWYMHRAEVNRATNDGGDDDDAPESAHTDITVDEVRSLTGIGSLSVNDVFELFASETGV